MVLIKLQFLACLMNAITFDKAYCLYPRTTIDLKMSIVVNDADIPRNIASLETYIGYGFGMVYIGQENALFDEYLRPNVRRFSIHIRKSNKCIQSLRSMGDKMCWVIDNSKTLGDCIASDRLDFDHYEMSTWSLDYHRPLVVIDRPGLKCTYMNMVIPSLESAHLVWRTVDTLTQNQMIKARRIVYKHPADWKG